MRTIWIITVLWMACSADAGPWLRPDGEGFMSVDSIGSVGRNQGDLTHHNGFFLEYGLSEGTTVGLKGGLNQDNDASLTLYQRKSLPIRSKGWVAAYDIGIGADLKGQKTNAHLRLGFAFGRGGLFDIGWVHLDGVALLKPGKPPSLKLEATLGTKADKGRMYLMQGFAESIDGGAWEFTLSPSVAFPLRKKRHIQIGLTASTQDGGQIGLKSAVWYEF